MCGQSGSGKTYSLGVMLEQLLLETRLPIVVLDEGHTVIEVRVTATGYFGKVVCYTIRKGKLPKSKVLCLRPGASKPIASC